MPVKIMEKNNDKTVAIAMSGGVDSSAAAVLLLQQGFTVFGVTMLHYDSACKKELTAVNDAAAVCKKLSIDHHVVEIKQEFFTAVIDDFITEYLAGHTPNPCVRCNPRIKWGVLLQKSLDLGADLFATGHYCRIEFDAATRRYCLRKAPTLKKDQSYALWKLRQEQLARTIFPLSHLTKPEVRTVAAQAGLAIADKGDSQEVCFIEDDDYNSYITEYLRAKNIEIIPGNILDQQGHVIGKHRGYPFYTIGQRKGLGIALGRPVFVTEINAEHNTIRIGDKEDLLSPGLTASDINWVCCAEPQPGMPVTAHIRYNDPGFPATLEKVDTHSFTIRFAEPRLSVTPGQSAVLYDGDRLLGGGIIDKAIK
ncbi:MAG TPA: tRNA 2-thiouridine(34) synthase MnmA [bacterium]|nr:tRNA 2-thiouridine(34) synthase MnmA [bacterium]HPN42874.1 tRNA 2-thiouridine(34) synthase MnmA [bacterium]